MFICLFYFFYYIQYIQQNPLSDTKYNVTIYKIYVVTYQCQCLMTCVIIVPQIVFVFLSGNAK